MAKTFDAFRSLLRDGVLAVALAVEASAPSLLQAWLYVPLGIVLILLVCFGMDVLLKLGQVPFPSSVAVLILLFFGLLLSEWLLGNRRTRRAVALLDVPASWSLRWINVFFTPTFVCLPLSSPIEAGEVGKMIGVFIVGFVVMMIITAYMTRALQLLTKSTKKAEVERAEELGEDRDEIPIAETPLEDESRLTSAAGSTVALLNLSAPPRAQEPISIAGRQSDPPSRDEEQSPDPGLMMRRQVPPPPARCRIWAAHISNRIDILTYALILLFVGIPVFFGAGYSMPLHLCVNVLAYFGASAIPHSWRRFLHPVIVSAFATAVTIYVFGLMRGQGLPETLHEYRTGLKYLQLWEGARADGGEKPGAGDMLGTVLDASIVALALPMFQYRRELKEHFLAIVVPNVLLSVGTLFSQPYICYVLGISPQRSLAFAARSLTLALAIPAVENLKGDHDTIAAVAIMSGVVGALVGQKMLDWLKIPDDDYVTRGVTLGANSSAVATALLLRTDPRAAALSSLSMSLFGAITVLFTSIPPMTAVIRSLVGL